MTWKDYYKASTKDYKDFRALSIGMLFCMVICVITNSPWLFVYCYLCLALQLYWMLKFRPMYKVAKAVSGMWKFAIETREAINLAELAGAKTSPDGITGKYKIHISIKKGDD